MEFQKNNSAATQQTARGGATKNNVAKRKLRQQHNTSKHCIDKEYSCGLNTCSSKTTKLIQPYKAKNAIGDVLQIPRAACPTGMAEMCSVISHHLCVCHSHILAQFSVHGHCYPVYDKNTTHTHSHNHTSPIISHKITISTSSNNNNACACD
jgi:hypothetical protein